MATSLQILCNKQSAQKVNSFNHKHKHEKNGQVRSSCAYAYAYVIALTSENGVDISTGIRTRPWTNHRSLWPTPHANISKAIWRTNRPPSCLSLGWGKLVSRIESNMPFCACVCPYAYALVKPGLRGKWFRHATREHWENIRFSTTFLVSNNKINKNTWSAVLLIPTRKVSSAMKTATIKFLWIVTELLFSFL